MPNSALLLASIRSALADAVAILSPVACAGCGAADRALCDACTAQLVPEPTPRPFGAGSDSRPSGWVAVTAVRYSGTTRRALLEFKESGRTDIAKALARPLGVAIDGAVGRAEGASPVEITNIPTSRAAWRRRGYDPVAMLCSAAGVRLSPVLVHRGASASQKTRTQLERAENVAGSMTAREGLEGRRFVIVDDVMTTGATLAEASRVISDAGGEVVAAAALAFTPRLRPVADRS